MRSRLPELAGILAFVQLAALVLQHVGVLDAAPPVARAERHALLATFPIPWILAFGAWMLVSFAFLGLFLFVMWEAVGHPARRTTKAAAWCAAAACAIGLATRVLLCGGLPLVARLEDRARFEAIERVLWLLEWGPVRLLQLTAVGVLTLGLRRAALVGRWTLALGGLYAAAALSTAGAGLRGSFSLAFGANVPEGLLLAAWGFVLARALAAAFERGPRSLERTPPRPSAGA